MNIQIKVENIKCGGCMNSIKSALLKMTNVKEVEIDKDTEVVQISSDMPVDREEIVNQLAKMGYPEAGKNNLLQQAKSYVSCAIGKMTEKV